MFKDNPYQQFRRTDPNPKVPFHEEPIEDRWFIAFVLIGAFVVLMLVLGIEP